MQHNDHKTKSNYKMLMWMMIIHFIFMFFLMYSMVNSLDEVYLNTNNFYMTALMVAPMGVTMLFMMPSMYANKKMNLIFAGASLFTLGLFWAP